MYLFPPLLETLPVVEFQLEEEITYVCIQNKLTILMIFDQIA